MTCGEFLRRLDAGESLDGPEARAHRESCAACGREFERASAVRAELAGMGAEPAPPFLHARVMAGGRAAARARAGPRFSVLRLAWAGPLLVLAFAAVLGGYGLWRVLAPPGAPSALPHRPAAALKEEAAVQPTPAPPALAAERQAPLPPPQQSAQKAAPAAPALQTRRAAEQRRASGVGAPSPGYFAPEPEKVFKEEVVVTGTAEPAPGAVGGVASGDGGREEGAVPPEPTDQTAKAGQPGVAETNRRAAQAQAAPAAPPSGADRQTVVARAASPAAQPATAASPVRFLGPPVTPCVIRPVSGGGGVAVAIAISVAPPTGATWHLVVPPDGDPQIVELHDRRDPAVAAALATIKALRLAPGRYLLERRAP